MNNSVKSQTALLEIRGLKIQGFSDERWHEIIKGIDLTLSRGEVLGLIGESGAGKSTLGLAAMGFTQPGCKITSGSIHFDGEKAKLLGQSHDLCSSISRCFI
jgi:peptide/nickel transport system ATP-binding protein